jgi:hypothetical protein
MGGASDWRIGSRIRRGRALQVKYSEYFGAKRRLSFKNENIRYDITTRVKSFISLSLGGLDFKTEEERLAQIS